MREGGTGWLGVNGACRYLDCSRTHLYGAIRAGKVPTRRLGTRIRIRVCDLDAYLERGAPEERGRVV
jgi:excisionase family DNA binding protein